jgi:Flp pilus assembly protein TadG
MRLRSRPHRRAALTIESALVYPLLFLLLFGLIVGGLGVFRYQQVALLAREASRYARVHGSSWASATKQTSPNTQQILQQVVIPLSAGLDTSKLTIQVQWIDETAGVPQDWDTSSKAPTGTTKTGSAVTNHVRVTLTYQWSPELFLVGPLSLQSVSEVAMAF